MNLDNNTLSWLFMAILLTVLIHSITLYSVIHLLVTGRGVAQRRKDGEVRTFSSGT